MILAADIGGGTIKLGLVKMVAPPREPSVVPPPLTR